MLGKGQLKGAAEAASPQIFSKRKYKYFLYTFFILSHPRKTPVAAAASASPRPILPIVLRAQSKKEGARREKEEISVARRYSDGQRPTGMP